MRLGPGAATWSRRCLLAVVLLSAAVIPGRASSLVAAHCTGSRCDSDGSVLWARPLSGSWVAQGGVAGTVPASGEAFAASAGTIAVLGYGTTLIAYQALTGRLSWKSALSSLPSGSAIISVRAWPAVVAVGVSVPAGLTGPSRQEIILSAATGKQIRSYPAAYYGGTVAADAATTVVVGSTAVTSYANATGRVRWQRQTGSAEQAWMVSGPYLYVAVTRGGYLVSAPVTALRRIDLRTGAERVLRPLHGSFLGALTGVVGGVALFSQGDELRGYSTQSGWLLWARKSAVLDLVDSGQQAAYVASGDSLSQLDLATGSSLGRPDPSVAAGLFAVRNGVALGLDQDALGDAWGYDMATRKVVWTSSALPWPHFFADLTGLGGSAGAGSVVTLLATCAAEGTPAGNGVAPTCLRPELAAIRY